MDWVTLITTLISTILPLIINKGPAANKVALQRRAVRYQAIADTALANNDVQGAFAVGEMASLCECLAAATDAGQQQQLLAVAQDGLKAALAAGKAA